MQGGHHVSFTTIAYFELFVCIVSAVVVLTLRHYNQELILSVRTGNPGMED